MTGKMSEETLGLIAVTVIPLGAAALIVRAGMPVSPEVPERVLVLGTALLTLVVAALPAARAVHPGEPAFKGELGIEGETFPIPPGNSGRFEFVVSGKIKQGSESEVGFVIAGPEEKLTGKLERTYRNTRVGRRGTARVAQEHTVEQLSGTLPASAQDLRLERLTGQPGGRLQIAAYHQMVPQWAIWALAVAALFVAAATDARMGAKGNVAIISAIAMCFGTLVAANAAPGDTAHAIIGGAILGAILGGGAGASAAWVVRKLVPRRRHA